MLTALRLNCIHKPTTCNSLHRLHPDPANIISLLSSLPRALARLLPMRPPEGARQHVSSLKALWWLRVKAKSAP